MPTTTVRISQETRERLKEFAKDDGVTITDAIDRMVERERRRRMWEAANASYAALRADPEAWAEWQSEIALWDSTIADGLPDEPEGDW
jgi:hypothetical protein